MTLGSRFVSPAPWISSACREGDGEGIGVRAGDGAGDPRMRAGGDAVEARWARGPGQTARARPASPAATTAPQTVRNDRRLIGRACRPLTTVTLRPPRRRT